MSAYICSTQYPVRPTLPTKRVLPPSDSAGAGPFGDATLLAAIVRDSNDAIISKTLDGTITSWNRGAERLFGYPAHEAVGRPITLIIPGDRRAEEELILERLRAGERLEHFETIRARRDGSEVDVSITVSPIRDSSGTVIGASKVARDIGDRKRYERALQELDQRKNEFLAVLSHELRGPLAPLAAAPVLLRHACSTPADVEKLADLVERQVAQLTHLVDDLLDISRIAAGKIVLKKDWVSIADVIQAAVQENRPLLESNAVSLELARCDGGPMHGDRHRLVQVCSNLISNAAKYTNAGGRVAVSCTREDTELVIRVRDDGIGIPPDHLVAIFGLYAQTPEARRKSPGGLGIGLAITQRLVELHGGSIRAYSEGTGTGSEFVVRLPLHPAGLQPAPPAGTRRSH